MKKESGITLIALIITIVVMLILAGVTINLTLGENGIFTTAQQAAQNYTDAQNKEMAGIGEFTNLVNDTINGIGQGGNVYIIYDGYLSNTLIPEEAGMTTTGTYQVYWSTDNFTTNTEAVATLTNTTYWSGFAAGVTGATATGGPTNEMFVNSWNENPAVNSTTLTAGSTTTGLNDTSKLYIPYTEVVENCAGYWLASPLGINTALLLVSCYGHINVRDFPDTSWSVRPLICLPSSITGTVGTEVSIDV